MAEWLLHCGVIAWADISHTFSALGSLRRDIFQAPFADLDAAFVRLGVEGKVSKACYNSWIGSLALDPFPQEHRVLTSSCPKDIPPGAVKHTQVLPDGSLREDWVVTTALCSTTSVRPPARHGAQL